MSDVIAGGILENTTTRDRISKGKGSVSVQPAVVSPLGWQCWPVISLNRGLMCKMRPRGVVIT